MVESKSINPPLNLKVGYFLYNHFKKKGNEQVWLGVSPSDISIVNVSRNRSEVVVDLADGTQYSVLSKNSKTTPSDKTLLSECHSVAEVYKQVLNGSIKLKWAKVNGVSTESSLCDQSVSQKVASSLQDKVHLIKQELDNDGTIKKAGLRPPQIGAIYSILSNTATSNEPVSVVLPTGTGKTESILGTIALSRMRRSLIIVPSNGLRNQFFNNCQNWGILRKAGVIGSEALNPVVCKIESSLPDEGLFTDIILTSNIIIATSSILNKLSSNVLKSINDNVESIFIDEAHHSAAPTWEKIKQILDKPQIVQFTATPFREDGKPIKGKIIFNYALEDAQKNNLFTKIDFIPVVDYDPDNWDRTIAEKAVQILQEDLELGHNHILMARVDNIEKAQKIFKDYYQKYSQYNPILVTSKSGASNALIDQLRRGESRIVVCVNMLGEGIDIPELKIAALHDIRKSLTVTLQFIGRFTRSNKSPAAAKIIANIADVKIEKRLKQLYKEDADWGKLIAFSSAKEIQKKIKFQEVLANFKGSKIPLFNLKPKLSAVVYKSKSNTWKPEEIDKFLNKNEDLFLCDINKDDGIAIAIYQIEEGIDWMDSKVFTENSWGLLLFYFDKEKQLLYVNSSQKNVDELLIDSVIDKEFKFEREAPFKCYYGLGNVVLFTLGIDRNTDSPIKYAMYAGSDIFDVISDMEKKKSSKSNTYGYGFKNGEELTIGASKHGKIWSKLIGNIQEWKDWCDEIGTKLLDDSIDVNEIFKGFLQPKRFSASEFSILERATSIDFPTPFYQYNESSQFLVIDGVEIPLNEITLNVETGDTGYVIEIKYENGSSFLSLLFSDDSFEYVPHNFKKIEYKKNTKQVDFLTYLKEQNAFRIRLLDGTFIENNYHFKASNPEQVFPLDTALLTEIDWAGVDISKESMGLVPPLITDSIQNKIYQLKDASSIFDVIVNDDNAGEAGDLLCFGVQDDLLVIEVIHCKYNLKSNQKGSRVSDFYELCCQAQKTIKNFTNLLRLFDHVKSRSVKTEKNGGTRFLKGDLKTLELLIKGNAYRRPKIKVILVQPGLIKGKAHKELLELLGGTHTLLKETLNADFEVLCS